MLMPFQMPRSFLGVAPLIAQPLAVVGAPTDTATSFRPGTRFGPGSIRDASLMLCDGVNNSFPVDLTPLLGDAGDWALSVGNTLECLKEIETSYSNLCKDHYVAVLGGDHSITTGILRSVEQKHGQVAVVHFDAHCDTWESHFGEPYGHGTWLRDVIEERLVDPKHVCSIGVRSPSDLATRVYLQNKGGTTISSKTASRLEPSVMASIIRQTVGPNLPVYLSLDIDCLDPAYAPGTGTPEIGGLSSVWLLETLELLGDLRWCGMDVVEVSPPYDHSQITSLAAATFVWQHLSCVAQRFIKRT
jgi:agmatinase